MSYALAPKRLRLLQPTQGLSREFESLLQSIREAQVHANAPISLNWKGELYDSAFNLADTCSSPNWDGYDASPISCEALSRAISLIDLLPEEIRSPELVPSPEGEIAFEWYSGSERVLSVIPQDGLLIYAVVIGPDHTLRGRAPVHESWPDEILMIVDLYFHDVRTLALAS